MINISDLSLNFSGEPLFKDVNLKFTQGNCYGVIGANGAGKSTFLRILSGDLDPSTGTVSIAPKTRMSVLKQDHFAFNEETVLNTVLGGNERLLEVMHEKDALYMKDPFTEEDGNRAAELESEFAEMGGWDAETEASQLLNGLGLDADAILYTEMKNLGDVEKVKVLLARALFGKPDILLLDEPLGALDLKLRKEMQLELKRLQREMNITFIYVTHDQEEALTMSDTVVVMNGGKVQQIGTPEDIYNEPKNAFVADFIGDSNIVDGVMHKDFLVSFSGVDFPCVDRGFAREQSVQVVVRPEDIEVVSPVEGQLVGVVNDVIFKGVHFEMHVECEGREWLIHSTRACTPGETIGMRIGPNEIHIMARSEG